MNRACPPCNFNCNQGRDCSSRTNDEVADLVDRLIVRVGVPFLVLFITGLAAGWIA